MLCMLWLQLTLVMQPGVLFCIDPVYNGTDHDIVRAWQTYHISSKFRRNTSLEPCQVYNSRQLFPVQIQWSPANVTACQITFHLLVIGTVIHMIDLHSVLNTKSCFENVRNWPRTLDLKNYSFEVFHSFPQATLPYYLPCIVGWWKHGAG